MPDETLPEFLLDLSSRTRDCLLHTGLTSIDAVAAKSVAELLLIPNFGRRNLRETIEMLAVYGLTLAGEQPPTKDTLPKIAAEIGLEEAECRQLRQLHMDLRLQQHRRDAVRQELEARLARIDARIEQIDDSGDALARALKFPIREGGETWVQAIERLGLAAKLPDGSVA